MSRVRAVVGILGVMLVAGALLGCQPERSSKTEGGVAAALLAKVSGAGEKASAPEKKVVYYKYVDDSGSIRFVERLEEVPKAQREESRIEWKAEPRRAAPAKAQRSRLQSLSRSIARLGSDAAPPANAASGSQPEVVLFTTSWCGWCRKAIAHLDRNGIRYDNRDIEKDRNAYAELKRRTGGTGVPVFKIDDELVIGFDQTRIDQLLGI